MTMQVQNKPGHEAAHSWRISLNLTRRIVRRMVELAEVERARTGKAECRSTVPSPAEFVVSVRLLRRTMRHLMQPGFCPA